MLRLLRLENHDHASKTGWITVLAVGAALFLIGLTVYYFARLNIFRSAQSEVLQLARVGATLVDVELHKKVQAVGASGTEAHLQLIAPLVKFHKALEDVHYVYTAVQVGQHIHFVAGTDFIYRVTGDELPADPVMKVYEGPDPELRKSLAEHVAVANHDLVKETHRSYLSAFAPFFDATGRPIGVLGVDMEATKLLKRLEQLRFGSACAVLLGACFVLWLIRRERVLGIARRLRNTREIAVQRNAAIRALAAGVAHEFSQHLTAALGRLELARLNLSDEVATKEELDAGEACLRRLCELTTQMRTITGSSLTPAEPVAARDMVESAISRLSERGFRRARIQVEAKTDGHIVCDESHLTEAIFQLLKNALEARPGDSVRVRIHAETPTFTARPLFGSLSTQSKYLAIEISDRGEAISEDNQMRLSDSFFSTKGSGRGFGLPVVRGAVSAIRGALTLARANSGNLFTLWLPV
jgi:nitrogen-specific signal transduction histidine kinase